MPTCSYLNKSTHLQHDRYTCQFMRIFMYLFFNGVNTENNQMMFSVSVLHNASRFFFNASPVWFDHRTQVFGNGLRRAESLQGEG